MSHKNCILLSLIVLSSYSIVGMHNENGKTEGELFESLEVQVKQYKESDSTE